MLVNANLLDRQIGKHLEAMVGFRNVAVHNYTEIDMAIVRTMQRPMKLLPGF